MDRSTVVVTGHKPKIGGRSAEADGGAEALRQEKLVSALGRVTCVPGAQSSYAEAAARDGAQSKDGGSN